MRKLLIILIILMILFTSSGQTYEQQSIIPTLEKWLPGMPFESLLSKFEIPYWGIKVSVAERGYYYFLEFLIRKMAHFVIFGILAASIYSFLSKYKYPKVKATFITLSIAIADEYHQSLIGGRTPSHQDVLLDLAGAITFLTLLHVWQRIKRQKNSLRIK